MGGSDDPLLGYMTYLGMHQVICHGPIDSVKKIFVDKKQIYSGTFTGGIMSINKPWLLGGYEREGGIIGDLDILFGESTQSLDDFSGESTQAQNSYLQEQLGTDIPAFRGVVSAVLKHMYLGMSTYLKPWSWLVRRIDTASDGSTQWYPAKAAIGEDMNPIHIIRECLTDPTWGMGYDSDDIDSTSFEAAADTLYAEGMGMSLAWSRGVRLSKFIDDVKKHINASLYVSRSIGKFTIKLIRDDYDENTLPELKDEHIIKVSNFVRALPADLTSEVTVVYCDRDTNNDYTVTARNIALANMQGSAVGIKVDFKGFMSGSIAAKVAGRELKARSTPIAKFTLIVTQEAMNLNIGDVFKFSYTPYGISSMIMRVTEMDLGTLIDNRIKLDCIEDVFGTSDVEYTAPPGTGWSDIITEAVKCDNTIIKESPYFDIAQKIGDNDAQNLDATTGYFGITAVQPIGAVINADLYVDRGSGYEKPSGILPVNMCPSATLVAAITADTETFYCENDEDMGQVTVGKYLIIDDEIMIIESHDADTNELTVSRGASDTVPATSHVLGARLFCCERYFKSDEYIYADGESINVKLLTRTSTDVLSITGADADSLTFDARQTRPYPPGQFKIDSGYYPNNVDGDIVVTWVGRNRLTQTAELIGMKDGNVTDETGTTYTCELYDADTSALLSQTTSIAAGTNTLTFAESLGSPAGHEHLTVKLYATRDGYDSWQTHEHTFYHNAYQFEDGVLYQFEDNEQFIFE